MTVIDGVFCMGMRAVAYLRGGHGAMPPFGPTMKIFHRRLYMKRCVFCRFPANFRKKWANLRLPLNVQKQKVFQLQAPRPGALPLDPAGGSAPRLPLEARAPRARHGPGHCLFPNFQTLPTPLHERLPCFFTTFLNTYRPIDLLLRTSVKRAWAEPEQN